jgi:predicted small lipoprotein YifL
MKVRMPRVMSIIVAGLTMGMLAACGTVGSPVPPESVGVTPIIEQQKKLEALEEKQRAATAAAESTEPQPDPLLQGQDVDLPPLQPVGTR